MLPQWRVQGEQHLRVQAVLRGRRGLLHRWAQGFDLRFQGDFGGTTRVFQKDVEVLSRALQWYFNKNLNIPSRVFQGDFSATS